MSRVQGGYIDRTVDESIEYPTKRRKRLRVIRRSLTTAVVLLVLAYVATDYWAEGLWFDELGFLSEFWVRSRTQILLGSITLFASLGFTFFNFNTADKLQFNRNCLLPNQANLSVGLGLKALLPILFFLGVVISSGLFHHVRIAITELSTTRTPLPTPLGLNFNANWQLAQSLVTQPIWLGLICLGAIALITSPASLLRVAAVILSICFSITATEEWARVLPALNPSSFNQLDPVFNEELSFYIFRLPLWELVEFWLSGILMFVLVAVTLEYLLAGNTFSQGRFAGFSSGQQRHLSAIASGLLAVTAMGDWIRRYELLYSPQGVSYGASFTDIYVRLACQYCA